MAEGVRLDIVLSDEGDDGGGQASRVTSPAGGATPAPGGGSGVGAPAGQEAGEGREASYEGGRVGHAINTVLAHMEDAADRFAKMAVPAAGNDMTKTFQAASEQASDALSLLGSHGRAAAVGLEMVTNVATSFASVVQAFVDRGQQLAGYSAEIASARAVADARAVQADIHEAEELGPGIASMTTDWNRAWLEIREILLPIKRIIVDVLAGAVEAVADGLAYLRDRLRDAVAGLESFFEFQRQYNPVLWAGGIGDKIVSKLESIRKSLDRNEGEPDTLAMLNRILGGLEAADGAPFAPEVPGGGPLDIPIFGGA